MDDSTCVELAEYCLSEVNTVGEAAARWGELSERQQEEVLEAVKRLGVEGLYDPATL